VLWHPFDVGREAIAIADRDAVSMVGIFRKAESTQEITDGLVARPGYVLGD
jgi:hypothetical protein